MTKEEQRNKYRAEGQVTKPIPKKLKSPKQISQKNKLVSFKVKRSDNDYNLLICDRIRGSKQKNKGEITINTILSFGKFKGKLIADILTTGTGKLYLMKLFKLKVIPFDKNLSQIIKNLKIKSTFDKNTDVQHVTRYV